jgi:hypothetical protein
MPPAPGQESERLTRSLRVDPLLTGQGWALTDFDAHRPLSDYPRHAIREYPTDNGPADYALCVDGQILGIVEAKRVSLGPQNVLTQAERYSQGVADSPFNFRGFRVPLLYSTNGEVVWFHDIRHPLSRSRRVATFHTPAALLDMLGRDFAAACATLQATPRRFSNSSLSRREVTSSRGSSSASETATGPAGDGSGGGYLIAIKRQASSLAAARAMPPTRSSLILATLNSDASAHRPSYRRRFINANLSTTKVSLPILTLQNGFVGFASYRLAFSPRRAGGLVHFPAGWDSRPPWRSLTARPLREQHPLAQRREFREYRERF